MARKKNRSDKGTRDAHFVAQGVEQVLGEALQQGAKSFSTKNEKIRLLINEVKKWIGEEGAVQAVNIGVAGIQTIMLRQGWNPVAIRIAVALLDDFFDGIKEGVRNTDDGKITPKIANDAWQRTLERHRSFEGAVKQLDDAERLELSRAITAFRADENRTKTWAFWRSKIISVQTLKDLLRLRTHANAWEQEWEHFLSNFLGSPPQASRILRAAQEHISAGRAESNKLAENIERKNKELDRQLRSMKSVRSRKNYG